jgi:hypothetical protein
MATCPNCGNKLGCSCQKRTLPNGQQGCASCAGKTGGSSKAPVITRKNRTNVPTDGKAPAQLNVWGADRYKDLQKYIKK